MKQPVMTVFILLEEAGGLWVGPNNLGVSTWTRFFLWNLFTYFCQPPNITAVLVILSLLIR